MRKGCWAPRVEVIRGAFYLSEEVDGGWLASTYEYMENTIDKNIIYD